MKFALFFYELNSKQKTTVKLHIKIIRFNADINLSHTTESEITVAALVILTALLFTAVGIAANDLWVRCVRLYRLYGGVSYAYFPE